MFCLKWLLVVLLVLYLLGRYLRLRFRAQTTHDEVHYARTEDGFLLALYRYRPEKPDPSKLPVVCCHGFTENRFGFELPGRSLPRFLTARGFEVWSLELRGQEGSRRRVGGRRFHWHWGLDDHILRDVPAAIACVREKTGAPRVHWIGHSMGGMVVYGHLARGGDASGLARVVTIGSPATFSPFNLAAFHPMARLEPLVRRMAFLPVEWAFTLWAPLAHLGLRSRALANPANLRGAGYMRLLLNGFNDTSTTLCRHFAHLIRSGRFVSLDSPPFDYEGNLGAFRVPLLAISGDRDRLVPPKHVARVVEAVGSTEKRHRVMGPESGHRASYGHCDLVIGDLAPEEVWPEIAAWLEAGEERPA